MSEANPESRTTPTTPQMKALSYLAGVEFATPSELGMAIGGTRSNKAQGLGRLGGAMGARLVQKGWAHHASWQRNGFPAYAITAAGRRMVKVSLT
jgi:hypothetical protein